jgi:GT2 family glycosyltransferase
MSTPSPNDFTITPGTGTPASHTLVGVDFLGSPMISVIIPTLDRPSYLWDTVAQVLRQKYVEFEVCVLDQSSTSEAEAAAERFLTANQDDPRLRYVRLPANGLPNARNAGIAMARGDIIVFIDDDVELLSPEFLAAHAVCYGDPSVGAVVGRSIDRVLIPNARRTSCHITWGGRTVHNLMGQKAQSIRAVRGSNMSFRAAVFRSLGGFDRRYTGNAILEETDMAARVRGARWELLFQPHAELFHLAAPRGGVRLTSAETTEISRFRNTGYFIAKHRGRAGLLPFALTFGLIAVARAVRWRSPRALWKLARSAHEGIVTARLGPDDVIPWRDTMPIVVVRLPKQSRMAMIAEFPVALSVMLSDFVKLR